MINKKENSNTILIQQNTILTNFIDNFINLLLFSFKGITKKFFIIDF